MASLFTKISKGEIPGKLIHEDEHCFAIQDIKPEAPKHFLLIPRKELTSVASANASDQALLGHLMLTANTIARAHGLDKSGYRLVINTGEDAGQTVPHLHIHILGGRPMRWPPG